MTSKPSNAKPSNAKPSKPATPDLATDREYAKAVTAGKRAALNAGKAAWTLGDLAGAVTVGYGDKTMQRYAGDIGIAYKTLINYRTIAAAYAEDERSADNSYTIHQVFVKQDDRASLLTSQVWTVREAQKLVQSRKSDAAGAGTDTDTDGQASAPALSEVDQARADVLRLEGELKAARARLAKLESATPAASPEPVKVTTHAVRGVPAHPASEPRTDCPDCRKNGVSPMPARAVKPSTAKPSTAKPSNGPRHARKPARIAVPA